MEVAEVEKARWPSFKGGSTGEEGQGLVEYALVLALVGIALTGVLGTFGGQLVTYYEAIASAIPVTP